MATKTRQLADFLVAGGTSDAEIQSVPHIRPGILQPAIAGKLMDGTTAHSGAYGTAQSDGHKYYYTDIRGRLPIKDPRIGAYFGSQRHKFKSLQKLVTEGYANATNVMSVDGRDWVRLSNGGLKLNGEQGELITFSEGFIEITGYFSEFHLLMYVHTAERGFKSYLDGTALESGAENTYWEEALETPYRDRFVEVGAVGKITTGATLGIHTMKIAPNAASDNMQMYGCELIAQDTGTTTRRNHVNIPAQSVISYGKKFSIGSDTLTNAVHKHWNPFAFKTDGSTAWASGANNGTSWPVGTGSSHNIDTTTSLGLEKWKHSDNYYKPYNGGRVVIWVANDGTIKTSVTVMPPNAKSCADSSSLTNGAAKANASIANSAYRPTFEAHTSDIDEDGLSEIAKVYLWQEFGNGAANGNRSARQDFSQMPGDTNDSVTWVFEDGLTNMSTYNWQRHGSGVHRDALLAGTSAAHCAGSFIGTGLAMTFSTDTSGADFRYPIAQNLPYGSHIWDLKYHTGGSNDIFLDGIHIIADGADTIVRIKNDITFFQPKKPPVPEDACILADYMLMADFVVQGAHNTGFVTNVSKGVRFCSHATDLHYHETTGGTGVSYYDDGAFPGMGYRNSNGTGSGAENNEYSLQAFGTRHIIEGYGGTGKNDAYIDGTDVAQTGIDANSHGDIVYPNADVDLGTHKFAARGIASGANSPYLGRNGIHIVTPIHTSHHYQPFETPCINELIGGDRNMEQTNLIVTPDGKTWDQVTRDTSYIGNVIFSGHETGAHISGSSTIDGMTDWRGIHGGHRASQGIQKGVAISRDKFIILENGMYQIYMFFRSQSASVAYRLVINGSAYDDAKHFYFNTQDNNETNPMVAPLMQLNRGDYLYILREGGTTFGVNHEAGFKFEIIKLSNQRNS